jgi:hypothetical protein
MSSKPFVGHLQPGPETVEWVKSLQAQALSKALKRDYDLDVPVLFESKASRDKEYKKGNYSVLVNTLTELRIVDENKLTWEQVLEFREDFEAKNKFRKLIRWLDGDMVGKPLSFIEDEIAQRLEDYEWAIRKHGIEAVLGSLSATLDSKALLSSGAAYAAFAAAGQGWLGMLSGASILIGKCAVHFAQEKLNLDDVKRSKPEIHFVHEVKKGFE